MVYIFQVTQLAGPSPGGKLPCDMLWSTVKRIDRYFLYPLFQVSIVTLCVT